MYYIENTVHIDAPREFTAEVLYNFSSFPQWNWLIRMLAASKLTQAPRRPVIDESKLKSDADPSASTSTVQTGDNNEGSRGYFEAHHQFGFTKEDESGSESDTTTKFTHREELRGALAWPFFIIFRGKLRRAYEKMARDFKAEVEKQYATKRLGNGAPVPT